jgi:hypothetical protein|tara:strand:+ start:3421 stop:3609 length:189 start_codon:yes stop_codon:yes gene_type:complete
MFVVRDNKGDMVCMCTRIEDTEPYKTSIRDDEFYTIEEIKHSYSAVDDAADVMSKHEAYKDG